MELYILLLKIVVLFIVTGILIFLPLIILVNMVLSLSSNIKK